MFSLLWLCGYLVGNAFPSGTCCCDAGGLVVLIVGLAKSWFPDGHANGGGDDDGGVHGDVNTCIAGAIGAGTGADWLS